MSLFVSLAGGGRERVFGCMVCADQFEDRVADYIRGKMLERGSWQGVKCVDVHCVLRMGGVPLPSPMFPLFCGLCLKMVGCPHVSHVSHCST